LKSESAISRRSTTLGVAALILALALALATPAAAGTISCTYNAGTKTVTATAISDFHQLAFQRDGDELEVSGTDCGKATRFNTDKIVMNDVSSHNLTAFVLLTEGPLRPGATNEPGSSDEIEIEVNLGTGDNTFIARGSRNMRAGTTFTGGFNFERQVNLNAGESTHVDHDVVVSGSVQGVWLQGTDSDDTLSANGGAGTGSTYLERALLSGWDLGRDSLRGGGGPDTLSGEAGADELRGGDDEDIVNGGPGNDLLRGNGDDDTLLGEDGDDDLNGGPGQDECDAGGGTNIVADCET
jgi:Ca2+-binding RTX toxin-like protein